MKNKLTDLNDHLFETIEFLGDRSIKKEELAEELRRAEMQCKVAQQLIANGNLILKAVQAKDALRNKSSKIPLLPEG